ncbi:DUF547 domain-containing protein [Fulvivirga kasyanovii]|uniref:DUF547 domain-containing protein n=1 Tax=Fulvivirga kasyanovii TaxID=396812 RepID=A0ABW9RH44_9BACT|nr:DUF547 domain-containing protein [Fulvivirga kasyanovii]MTI23372.1 DUF547 domain-containing protein [Fulvivirga kasyanovii]
MLCVLLLSACGSSARQRVADPPPHDIWNALLHKHVDGAGWVNYEGFMRDQEKLEEYLKLLSNNAPDKDLWSREEQLAYWINAYNAFTVKLIIDNYPLESIRDLDPVLSIPAINTVWHRKFFEIGGKKTSLDEIEHEILRKEFAEPRIHFAINCASYSCPPLRSEAYKADIVDQQLNEQAILFINDPLRNQISHDRVVLSRIFKWFKSDFTRDVSLVEYLNRYSRIYIADTADLEYLPYNWQLNEKP